MALQFVLGKASKNHFKKVVDNIDSSMRKNPDDRYFYLVPNHIKFNSELKTLDQLNSDHKSSFAESRVQVFSFSRLVWYFMGESEGYQLPRLSADAINMLLYQIIRDKEDELTVFKGEGSQPGFIQQVADQISELQQGKVDPDTLEKISQQDVNKVNPELVGKLHDIAIIYRAFIEKTDGKYLYPVATLQMLNQYLEETDLSHMHFYISDFSQFSAQEMQIVQTLISKAEDVTVDLKLNKQYASDLPDNSSFFFKTGKLYYQLYNFARSQNQKVLVDQYTDEDHVNAGLKKLEEYWISSNEIDQKILEKDTNNDAIEVYQAPTPYDELMNVAIKIRTLVASGKYRYSDILIVTRNLEQYANIIDPIFKMQKIPYFVDIQKKMDNHPLVDLIDALFSIYNGKSKRNYRYADVMRLLKSELLIPLDDEANPMKIDEYREDVALTENFILKNGFEGSRWTQKEDWHYSRLVDSTTGEISDPNQEISDKINVIRNFIKNNLPPFYAKIENANTGKEAAKILYQFLDNHGVISRLQKWQNEATEKGDLQEAGQSEQVWNVFVRLLDDFVNVLGDSQFEFGDFLDLLKAGFKGSSYSQIPSTLDQVSLSETGMVQPSDKKITFMIGSDDDNMPARIENNRLFNDSDREQMGNYFNDNQYLSDSSEMQMISEPYLNYLSFMIPSDKLIFSYNTGGNDADTERNLSPYVNRIMINFNLLIQKISGHPKADSNNILGFIGSKRTSLKYLVKALYDAKTNNTVLSSAWKEVEQQLLKDPTMHNLTQKLMGSLTYKNVPSSLKPEIITNLYGNQINTSISKLEEYYYDPYEYFLKYGLKLRKRDEFELNAASTGTFYHDSLDQLTKKINDEHIDISTLSDQDIHKMVDEVTKSMVVDDPNMQYEILKSSNRMGYITQQLILTVTQMAKTIKNQSHYSRMRPIKSEVIFGETGDERNLDGLAFDLGNGKSVNVRGRIDRIDRVNIDGTDYLGIVDYKSGDKRIDLDQAYDGTRMQMLTYLDAVINGKEKLSDDEKVELAGALYMHISDPILKPDKKINLDDPEQLDKALMKEQKYHGILVDDGTLLKGMMDKVSDSDLIYPYKFKGDGTLNANSLSNVINPNDLGLLLKHNEQLIKDAGSGILGGNISLEPAEYKDKSNIKYSDYKSIMQFDPLLPENNYRIIEPIGGTHEVIDRLREEERKNGE